MGWECYYKSQFVIENARTADSRLRSLTPDVKIVRCAETAFRLQTSGARAFPEMTKVGMWQAWIL